ncbi:electron transfer flavoprotein subunit alpha/FixB family protein [Actinospica robiniae]|uniref:electron transfer flavoprotein subunit alpha/FixB family protein n=1 Tax=Actinospica robiniae TaxID=304901 RepID=UPI00146FA273|nr:electron transfer flavoprotein subunit alpha/FixB family protein [Actinospica robiniae]
MPSTDAVLVLAARSRDGGLSRSSAELLTAARRVAAPVAVLPEPVDDRICGELGRYGAERVLSICAPELDAVVGAACHLRPPLVLLPATTAASREIAGRLAVRLEAGIVTDVVGIDRGPEGISVLQETCGGRVRVASTIVKTPAILTIRPGAVVAEPEAGSCRSPAVEDLCVTPASAVRAPRLVRRVPVHPLDGRLLTEADVVVAGGRGVGSAEGFALLAEVARALGGCLGATHTAGELGWAPDHARISLPGNQIRPRLYLAVGVSGSLRHRAAIRGARTVVAVDRDRNAPILREADLAVVGDLHAVLPALLAELRRRDRARSTSTEPSEPSEPSEPAEA